MKDMVKEQFIKTELMNSQSEISGDYILPDSFPDVKNILSANARIEKKNKYFGANDFEINGCIVYNIMFSAMDENGEEKIFSVIFKDDFKNTTKYKNSNNCGVGALTRIKDISCRMANPRKFSIKTIFENLVYEDTNYNALPTIDSDVADYQIEYKWNECDILRCRSLELVEHSFSDNIELDMKSPEIDEIVHYDIALTVKDDRSGDLRENSPKLGGVFTLNVLYKDIEGKYRTAKSDIPFGISFSEDELALLGDFSDSQTTLLISPTLTAVNVNTSTNQYSEKKIIEFDADYDIDLMIIFNETVSYVSDAYSTNYKSECRYEGQIMNKPAGRIKNNFTYTETKSKSEEGLDALSIVASGIPAISEIRDESNAGYVNICGKISQKCTFSGEENKFKNKELVLPFTYKSSLKCQSDTMSLIGSSCAVNSRLREDSDRVYAETEIYLDYISVGKHNATLCKAVKLDSMSDSGKNNVLFSIYYPEKDEECWEIAKSKKTTCEKLYQSNPDMANNMPKAIIIE